MGIRTVRLDEATERTLARLCKATGLSKSEVLKRGLRAYLQGDAGGAVRPYEIYRRLDLGEGGWSLGPASDAKRVLKQALRRKLRP